MARVKAKAEPATLAQTMNADGDRRAAMLSVASRFSGWRPAKEVLRKVRAVPTIFPYFDLVTKVGGLPIERPTLIHGPSNHGKTEFCLGLGKSFLDRGHFFALIDAEHATPERWLRQLGIDMNHPGFHAKRPLTYEDAVAALEAWATAIGEARIKGEIPEDTTGVCVIDSIGKLCPESLMKEMEVAFAADMEEAKLKGKKGIDGAGGRAGQILAARNNAWMRRIVPLAGHTGVSVVIITRENENTDANLYAEEFTVVGGKAINYDASLTIRILRSGYIGQGEGATREVYGERHKAILRKTKVARKEDRQPVAYFNSSNGMLDGVPAGFDTVRDYFETAIEIGLIEQPSKGRYEFGKVKLGHGEHNVVKRLYAEPALYEALCLAVRDGIAKIIAAEPGESDD